MKIATFQGPVVFGDADANLETTESALAEAESRGAEILAMPETFLHGFFSPRKFTTEYASALHEQYQQMFARHDNLPLGKQDEPGA